MTRARAAAASAELEKQLELAAAYAGDGAFVTALGIATEAFHLAGFIPAHRLAFCTSLGRTAAVCQLTQTRTEYSLYQGVDGEVVVHSQRTGRCVSLPLAKVVQIAIALGVDEQERRRA